jgi:hypothetical protein
LGFLLVGRQVKKNSGGADPGDPMPPVGYILEMAHVAAPKPTNMTTMGHFWGKSDAGQCADCRLGLNLQW